MTTKEDTTDTPKIQTNGSGSTGVRRGRRKGQLNRETKRQLPAVEILTDAGLTREAISERTGLSVKTIGRVQAEIRSLMASEAATVAEDWRIAVKVASRKGKHEAAKDWLLHAKAIDPVQNQQADLGPRILIGIAALPGIPASTFAPLDCTTNGALEAKPAELLSESDKDKLT